MLEKEFQARLIKDLKAIFRGCVVCKLDPDYMQGIPDLLVLYQNRWAILECKKSEDEPHRPNQDYYIDKLDRMSFARFIFPENKEEVLCELQFFFKTCKPRRTARLPRGEQIPLDSL